MIAAVVVFFIALLLTGLPLYVALFGLSAFLFLTTNPAIPLLSSVIGFQKLQSQEFIIAIPMFTFISYMLAYSKSPQKIFNIFNKMFGHIRGGDIGITLALMTFFTALTGASGATILALGGLLYPLLVRSKKTPDFSLGLITSSGSIGLLVAPSLPVIIYSVIASQNISGDLKPDVNTLFKVGILPSIVMLLMFFLYSFFSVKQSNLRKFNWAEAKTALWEGKYEIFIPVIIYGGIYSGIMTILEAAVIGTFYVFLYIFVLRKDLSIKQLPTIVIDSMKITGSIFIIMSTAFMLTNYIVDQKLSEKIFNSISPYINSEYSFLLLINCLLLLVGFLMDIYSAILIVLPILIPIVEKYGINPYHFAMIFLLNLEIGYITPPVGMNLFISSHRFRKPIFQVYKTTIPFFFIMIVNLLLITYIPQISTFTTKVVGVKNTDFKPPAQIKDIVVEKIGTNGAFLRFKAVGDDGLEGQAADYIIRYSELPIETQDDIDFAHTIEKRFAPKESGEEESIEITGLSPQTSYYFVISAKDKAGNESKISQPVSFTTK